MKGLVGGPLLVGGLGPGPPGPPLNTALVHKQCVYKFTRLRAVCAATARLLLLSANVK